VRRGLALLVSSLILLVVAVSVVAVSVATAATAARQPPIAGTTLDGKRLALTDLRGKPVVINVWSSW
jgi:hypothetical protein